MFGSGSFLENPLALVLVIFSAIPLGILFILGIVKSFTRKTSGWIVVTIISGIMALACLVTFVAQIGLVVKKEIANGQKIEQVFTVAEGKYSLKVPKSWKHHIELNAEADLALGNLVAEQYLLLFVEAKADLAMNLQEYAQTITDQTAANLSDLTIDELNPVDVNGLRGLQRRFVGENEGVRATFIHTCVETEDALCQILCWTLPSKQEKAFPIYEKVLQTFTVTSE